LSTTGFRICMSNISIDAGPLHIYLLNPIQLKKKWEFKVWKGLARTTFFGWRFVQSNILKISQVLSQPINVSIHLSIDQSFVQFSFIIYGPVRIRVRVGPPHPLVCRKRQLNGAVLRMRPEKPRPRVTAGVAR
jgi:hypothetical protein